MTTQTDTVVRRQIEVAVPPARAYQVFTEQFDAIKPRDHTLLDVPVAETVFEARVGGNIYDRGTDGTECRWARVLVVEPPRRLVFTWDISPAWEIESDPARCSEIEVTFTESDPGRTLVVLEHRHLDRHGEGWQPLVESVGADAGWPLWLARFADVVGQEG